MWWRRPAGRKLKADTAVVDEVVAIPKVHDRLFGIVAAGLDGDEAMPWEAAWSMLQQLPSAAHMIEATSSAPSAACPLQVAQDSISIVRTCYLVQILLSR